MNKRGKPGDLAWKIKMARSYALPAMRQEDLAREIGVSRALVGMWESNQRKPVPEVISHIAEATGIDVDWFFDGDPTEPKLHLSRRLRDYRQLLSAGKSRRRAILGGGASASDRTEEGPARPGWTAIDVFGPASVDAAGKPTRGGIVDTWVVPEWGTNAHRWGLVVSDSTMEPDFEVGDTVIFEARRPESGLAVFAEGASENLFRVFERDGDSTFLVPTARPDGRIDSTGWKIAGVAIVSIRDLGRGVTVETRFASGCRPRMKFVQ